MHIVLVDDSIPFDGHSPLTGPLGGAEKAFASLPGALARRGHRVQVFNRAAGRGEIEDAVWEGWQGDRPVACDVLIAFRRPELLGFIASAARRILWLASSAEYLKEDSVQGLLYAHRPTLVFMGEAHRASYRPSDIELATAVIAPGIRPEFLSPVRPEPFHPPVAVATCHPLLGLEWLIGLWIDRVHPRCPHATLRLYSAMLDRGLSGAPVPDAFRSIAALAIGAQDKGIAIYRPGADGAMAEVYRGARAHLYPGDAREAYCHTLAESQACGTPAVARPFPATAEQIADGVSGHLAADADGFSRMTLKLLEDDTAFMGLSTAARERSAGRDPDSAAATLEANWR
jgi:glycosyltransferase involved in cell wall biosynthesis